VPFNFEEYGGLRIVFGIDAGGYMYSRVSGAGSFMPRPIMVPIIIADCFNHAGLDIYLIYSQVITRFVSLYEKNI
jgi:hypothetical protein